MQSKLTTENLASCIRHEHQQTHTLFIMANGKLEASNLTQLSGVIFAFSWCLILLRAVGPGENGSPCVLYL